MATTRLPQPGGDDGDWGDILNAFLQVAHDSTGALLPGAITTAGGLTTASIGTANGVAGLNSSAVVPTNQLGSGTASASNFLRGDGTWAAPSGGSSTLASDTDVAISSPSSNQVLTYNSGTSKWTNTTLLDGTASDIKPLGTQAAGTSTKAAAADHVHPTTGIALLAGATFTGGVNPAVTTVVYGSTIAVNAAGANDFRITLTGNATIANPTNPTDGQRITFQITQDATGGRTVTWGSAYNFGTAGTPTLTTAANLTDVIGFVYNATKAQWLAAGAALGF